jgi:hypothetical protein
MYEQHRQPVLGQMGPMPIREILDRRPVCGEYRKRARRLVIHEDVRLVLVNT